MISLKKYLEAAPPEAVSEHETDPGGIAPLAIAAYRSALLGIGNCSLDACPGLGNELKNHLDEMSVGLSSGIDCPAMRHVDTEVQQQLQQWGRQAARHYQHKSEEVRELLIVMARTAESVGERDQRCAGQLNEVTSRLTAIASLDDLTEVRASIVKSAAELKTSIERMTTEGTAAIDRLRSQVSTYRTKLEAAEQLAFKDALTGLRSRLCVERHIENQIASGAVFCIAIVDIDHFKRVNDEHGHLTGDQVLKQFASELVSACRSTDLIGRWGGDEFIIALDSGIEEAAAQTERLSKWVCGNYEVPGKSGALRLRVQASIGLADHVEGESMNDLIARADAAMYRQKSTSKANGSFSK